jgi:hypothetical protein
MVFMRYLGYLVLMLVSLVFFSCKKEYKKFELSAEALHKANRLVLEVAMEDGFPPPIASRVYVYPHIGCNIALYPFFKDSLSDLATKLSGFEGLKYPKLDHVHPELAALLTFYKVAQKVVFSEQYMKNAYDSLMITAKNYPVDPTIIKASVVYSDSIAASVISRLVKDNYIQTRTMERFTSVNEPGKWKETPPDYQQALEPHWPKIKPFVIDSAGIYKSKALPEFSRKPNSPFYLMAKRTYDQSKALTDEQKEIAWFWDDNPNTSDHRGHAVAVIHKISPPGHWLNIINQIAQKEKYSFVRSSKIYAHTSVAMFDGIISTWHQKYLTNLVRPITYIQENIDPSWTTLIQTPPFPEYTSGHSVISASAATILSKEIGANYAFEDKTSTLYGAKPRTFNDFQSAAWEVSLSRLYGGIHYYNGIQEGNIQGKWIGDYVLNKLK